MSIINRVRHHFEEKVKERNSHYSIEYFKALATTQSQTEFIILVEPLFESYEDQLKKNGEIDFNDMINLATRYISDGICVCKRTS